MNKFLSKVTQHIYKEHRHHLSDCAVIFPTLRACLFFKHELEKTIKEKEVLFLPNIITLDQLFQDFSQLQKADNLTLTFLLHKIYQKARDIKENFDDFYVWGEMLLKDFDDLDKNLIDTKIIFKNIEELKQIEKQFQIELTKEQAEAFKQFLSSFDTEPYGENRKKFIEIWQVLFKIYNDFKTQLKSENIAYSGMIYRDFVEDEKNLKKLAKTYKKIFFIGFNALNECQKNLFHFLKDENIAEFYWDYDEFYLKNNFHEASLFLRENIKLFPETFKVDDFNHFKENKNIEIIGTSSNIGQAKLVHQILKENPSFKDEKTAIILTDSNLLLPVLYVLPSQIENINITLGYPIKTTPIYSLIYHLIELQRNTNSKNDFAFHYKDILSILKHQYLSVFFTEESEIIEQYIQQTKQFYFKANELPQLNFLSKVFKKLVTVHETCDYLLNILLVIFQNLENKNKDENETNYLEKEFVYQSYLSINRLKSLLLEEEKKQNETTNMMQLPTFLRLLKKMFDNETIAFEGEPLLGLQIMGLMDTQGIDFENIILLSANEGILPKTAVSNSYIPYNLRKAFGLATVENQDALFSYGFYRLLQRSKNIYLVYNNVISEDTNNSEMSRFLFQLLYESDFKITQKNISENIELPKNKEIIIKKTPDIIQNLLKKESKEESFISPNAINTYLDCSLKFYFKYVVKLKSASIISEEINEMTFGILLHDSLYFLYKNFQNKFIYHKDLDEILKNNDKINKAINEAVEKNYLQNNENTDFNNGNLAIVKDVLKEYISGIIRGDKKNVPFEILSLEKVFFHDFSLNFKENHHKIKLYGTIDRIDRKDGKIRIIDYKTANSNDFKKLKFNEIEDLFEGKNKEILQVFIYSFLFEKNNKTADLIVPSLFFTREIFNPKFKINISKGKEIVLDFAKTESKIFFKNLEEIIKKIFSTDEDFCQTEDKKKCEYCDFLKICKV